MRAREGPSGFRVEQAIGLPLAAQAHQLYLATAAAGHGGEDDSAVIKFYAALAGLQLPQPKE